MGSFAAAAALCKGTAAMITRLRATTLGSIKALVVGSEGAGKRVWSFALVFFHTAGMLSRMRTFCGPQLVGKTGWPRAARHTGFQTRAPIIMPSSFHSTCTEYPGPVQRCSHAGMQQCSHRTRPPAGFCVCAAWQTFKLGLASPHVHESCVGIVHWQWWIDCDGVDGRLCLLRLL